MKVRMSSVCSDCVCNNSCVTTRSDVLKIAKNAFGNYVDPTGEYHSVLVQIKVSNDRG